MVSSVLKSMVHCGASGSLPRFSVASSFFLL